MCCLQLTPQQVPASSALLTIAMGFYFLLDLLVALPGTRWQESMGLTCIDVIILVTMTWMLLRYRGGGLRFNQTLSALAGTGGLLGFFALPLVLMVQLDPVPPMAGVLWIALMIWNLVVRAHILRHALGVSFAAGLLASIAYLVVVLGLVQWFFPISGR